MPLITRESDYAISALVSLARNPDGKSSALVMAGELGIPGAFLRRILQRLGRAGMIRSRKGIGGGFELAKKSQEIMAGDVVTALQGPIRVSDCGASGTACKRRGKCLLRGKLKAAEQKLVRDLMGISIASLAGRRED